TVNLPRLPVGGRVELVIRGEERRGPGSNRVQARSFGRSLIQGGLRGAKRRSRRVVLTKRRGDWASSGHDALSGIGAGGEIARGMPGILAAEWLKLKQNFVQNNGNLQGRERAARSSRARALDSFARGN